MDKSEPFDRMNRYGEWSIAFGESITYGFYDESSIILYLIIDDGVPERDDRLNIFNPLFTKCGLATGYHSLLNTMAVLVYAGEYVDME